MSKIQTNVYPIEVVLEQDAGGVDTLIVGEFETFSTAIPQLQQLANTDLFLNVLYRRLGSDAGFIALEAQTD